IVIPPAIFFYYSTLFDSRFKTLQQNHGIYGAPKIHAFLTQKGYNVSVKYVQKIMRLLGITSVTIKKFKHYTNSKVKGVFKNMLKSMMLSILKNATILMKFGKQIILC
ncbi:IS3 family transposase, partial [Lactococcus lactis]|uniref:IS3 family transposase n=1 Tax=Lactococcus lactis TaxID=1358 RepID=UPI00288D9DCB